MSEKRVWTKELGQRLTDARKRKGWEISDVAERAGRGKNTVRALEDAARSDGKPHNPNRSTYSDVIKAVGDQELADIVGVDLDAPMSWEVETTGPTPTEIGKYRAGIDQRIDPAFEAFRQTIVEAFEEALREARGS